MSMSTAHHLAAKTDPAALRAARAASSTHAPSMLPDVVPTHVPNPKLFPLVPCCICDCPAFWQDGYEHWHCVECDEPPSRDMVKGGRGAGEKKIEVINGF